MKSPRKCEVCGREWKSKFDYGWILLCPACGVSGYHIPTGAGQSKETER